MEIKLTNTNLLFYLERFINRTDIWFKQYASGGRYGYCCVKPGDNGYLPVNTDLISKHLAGSLTMSLVATNAEGLCKWACWDSDTDAGHLDKIEALLKDWGFDSLREAKRYGRDGHSWLFFDHPVHAKDLLRFNIELLSHARLSGKDVEFFPKSVNNFSQVRGPLGIHLKPGANRERGWFENAPKNIDDQLNWLAEQPLNSADKLLRITTELHKADHARRRLKPLNLLPRSYDQPLTPILDLVTDKRKLGNDWATQCPLCAIEGHDDQRDNLRISLDGKKFCCVYGGPGQVHKAGDIAQALQR